MKSTGGYSVDFRKLIIKKIKDNGGNEVDGTLPKCTLSKISGILGIHKNTVKSIWIRFCQTGSVKRMKHGGGAIKKTNEEHERFIDYLIAQVPSMTLGDIKQRMEEILNISISKSSISRMLTSRMTRKRLVRPAFERFSDENLVYTETFLRVMRRTNYRRLKYFDESGFALPDVCNPRYGRASEGERAIEVNRHRRTRNITLNLMIGAGGISYANIVNGPSNTDTFVEFFMQAVNATTNDGDFALKPGDMVILDNCPIHHGNAERIVSHLLNSMHIEYVFLPTYSPHLNPVELSFQHIKSVFKSNQIIRNLAKDNLEYAVMHVVNSITAHDCNGYFKHVGYINM